MRRTLIALAAAACLATTACSAEETSADSTSTEVGTPAVDTMEPAMTASPGAESPAPGGEGATKEDVDLASHTFSTSAQDAIDKAVEEAGGGFVHTIELDWSSDTSAWVYEVEVLDGTTEYDIDVHADTGEVLDVDSGSTDDVEGAIDLSSPMTWETARDKALEAVRGPVTSWKLEYDDDGMEYVFEIDGSSDDDVDVKIDVNSGEVEIDD